MGTGSIREGIRRFELVQGETGEVRPGNGDGAQARAGGDDLLPAGAVRAQGAEPGEVQLAGDAPDVLAGTGRTWARTARVREQRR